MSIDRLLKHIPENSVPFLKEWFRDFYIHIKITKGRKSKLGDYRKQPDKSHKVTINGDLPNELFFFVLTHELAHLIAFETFGRRILPHGKEWKITFSKMLLQSIKIYSEEAQPMILKFAKSPKANFMASPDLVKHFRMEDFEEKQSYLEEIQPNEHFIFRKSKFRMDGKIRKNYICTNLQNGVQYRIHPLAKVIKLD